MKNSGHINAEIMDLNNKLGDLAERQVDITAIEDDAERSEAIEKFQKEFKDLKDQRDVLTTRYKSAILSEEANMARDVPVDAKPKEVQEFLKLRQNFSMENVVVSTGNQNVMQGASAEFASECLGVLQGPQGGGVIPLEYFDEGPLMKDVEEFALNLADGARTVIQNPVLERVYADTVGEFMRVTPLSADPGVQSWPTFALGGNVSQTVARDTEVAESNTQITVAQVTPAALSLRYRLNVEDSYVLGNNEPLHNRDIIAAMRTGYDDFLVEEFDGDISDATQTNTNTWGEIATLGSTHMHGVYAPTRSSVRCLVSIEGYRYGAGAFFPSKNQTNALVPLAAIDYLEERGTEVRATSRISHTSNVSQCFYARGRHEGAIAPMWGGIELIRDIYTGANRRRVWLTAVSYVGFLIRRSDVYGKFAIKTA